MKYQRVSTWKVVLGFLFDIIVSLYVFGGFIAFLTGELDAESSSLSFDLKGIPALITFALIFSYFLIMNRFLNGTFGKKIFNVRRLYIEVPEQTEPN